MHNQFKTQKLEHLMLAMGPRDLNSAPYSPVHCSSHSMTSFQSSELTELPVVENSQLFAQRAHSARYAPSDRCRGPIPSAPLPPSPPFAHGAERGGQTTSGGAIFVRIEGAQNGRNPQEGPHRRRPQDCAEALHQHRRTGRPSTGQRRGHSTTAADPPPAARPDGRRARTRRCRARASRRGL